MTSFPDVLEAARRIRGFVHRTPVLTSRTLDAELGAEVFCKCENLQKVGAFKARGAANAVLALRDEEAPRGVITHSSGNHAAALAYAAGLRSLRCTVVMPRTAPRPKIEAVRGYGARIVFCGQAEREATCERLMRETGSVLIHPFEDPRVIAGQGTAAFELIEDVGGLDVLVVPVGGGGLCAGTTLVARALLPRASVLGAEPVVADDAARSLATGVRQPRVEGQGTIADGLLAGLGERAFGILREGGVRIVTVEEREIVHAARFFFARMKIVVEPSAATALAAARKASADLRGKRVGLILSGGNTDGSWLAD
ncbi:MAG: pyridoxal-phosphate dependent enzyme [Planctomycetota bacterium]